VVTPVTLWSCKLRNSFLKEALLTALHVFPGIEAVDSSPNLLLFFSVVMFSRVLVLGRVFKYLSSLNTPNGRFIGSVTGRTSAVD
jgi:hypothetical protein